MCQIGTLNANEYLTYSTNRMGIISAGTFELSRVFLVDLGHFKTTVSCRYQVQVPLFA